MREIKFRVWSEREKAFMFRMRLDESGQYFDRDCALACKPMIWQQFTGLKDKNGEEIYEGTLLKDPQGNIGEVFYLAHSFAIRWKRRDGSWDTDSCFGYGEVIGNIYENPDLLNK